MKMLQSTMQFVAELRPLPLLLSGFWYFDEPLESDLVILHDEMLTLVELLDL